MAKRLPTQPENPNGLHQKYVIRKADGSPIDPGAVYFTLRIDAGGKDPIHTAACHHAVKAYCQAIFCASGADHLQQLALELTEYLENFGVVAERPSA